MPTEVNVEKMNFRVVNVISIGKRLFPRNSLYADNGL